ncbi:hypothetical protein TraAM80_04706 [Trypanosoma rangeli]|uniref:Uncharacterized protein n=1 Tax=Trypanosoma rangeli TaxID=5698 RepID=A0A3S5IR87_TRYRA|nr:uncharacterized protein TraAM80_04706 [Trypanosoma rangeli]RNF05146.1 hypothetical protein TraAM80_04706 [Trypanosoma rangeli]|eukprot:RNF05146.1 hypothetical protein TraAM80_04706 [Trypanosoma rangeli]
MNLMDDDSSTYCSRQTRRSMSPSQTPEQCSAALEQSPEVVSTGSAAHSSMSTMTATSDTQEAEQANLSAQAHGGEANPSRSAAHAFPAKPTPVGGLASTEGVGVSDGEGAAEPNNLAGTDDGASSIEFAVDNETFRTSKSPPPSTFLFVRDSPVETFHKGSLHPQQFGDYGRRSANITHGNKTKKDNVHEWSTCAKERSCKNKKHAEEAHRISSWLPEEKAVTAPVYRRRALVESESRLQSGRKGRATPGSSASRRGGSAGSGSQRGGQGSCASLDSKNAARTSSHRRRGNSSCPAVPMRSLSEDNKPRKRWGSHGALSGRSYISDNSLGRERKGFERRGVPLSPYRGRASYSPRRPHGSASLHQTQATPLRRGAVHSPALERLRRYRSLEFSTPGRRKEKEEIVTMLVDEMDMVCNEVKEFDMTTEYAMLRNPFERLYHMNNRRDRDERRSRILHYMKLDEAKRRLLAENDEVERRRHEWRREHERQYEELFDRLHFEASTRGESGQIDRFQSTRNGNATAANDALFERLYKEAVESMTAKQERARRAELEREQKELDETLHARILARLEMEARTQRLLTPRERETRATAIQSELLQNPDQLREYLRMNRLSKKEEKLMAWRLTRQGYKSAAKLAQEREKKELEGCTFQPRTNKKFNMRCCSAAGSYGRATLASLSWGKKVDANPAPATSPQRSSSRSQKLVCEELYRRGVKQRERQKALVEEADKQKRLSLLKAKLKEDHHFRRRVELDPSLAQRFMASLAV